MSDLCEGRQLVGVGVTDARSSNSSDAFASRSSILDRAKPTWMRIQSPGTSVLVLQQADVHRAPDALTSTIARSSRSDRDLDDLTGDAQAHGWSSLLLGDEVGVNLHLGIHAQPQRGRRRDPEAVDVETQVRLDGQLVLAVEPRRDVGR